MTPRILFILHLPPPVHGAAMVGKYIHDSKLINEQFDCQYISLTTASSLEDIGRISLGKLKVFIGLLRNIRRQVKDFRPALVYVTPNAKGGAFYKDFVVVQMLKGMGCNVVAHYHNKGVSTKQDNWLYDKLYRRFFRNLKVILLSKSLYQDVEKYVKWEDVYICPNGIPVDKGCRKEVTKHENPVPRLLFLSNLIESKGVFVLLDALKILKDKGYSFICDFVGGETKEIDAKRFNEEVEKRGLNEIALYHGRKYGEEKEAAFEQSDVFVLPTYNETFGLVNLEAMSHKKPVVSTNEGGIPDVIKDGENGLIAERKDSESLAQCIGRLLDSEELRQKMGEDGYKKLKEAFTEEKFEANLLQIVNEICASGGGKFSVELRVLAEASEQVRAESLESVESSESVESVEIRVQSCAVRYLGRKYGEEKERIFERADIFVFPTYYSNECFPLVLLEAMQYGLPCVTTDEGGIRDIVVKDTGFTVHGTNLKELAVGTADALEQLIVDVELRKRMGEAGRKRLEELFTEKRFEKRMKEIL